jgi:hypothetical protein
MQDITVALVNVLSCHVVISINWLLVINDCFKISQGGQNRTVFATSSVNSIPGGGVLTDTKVNGNLTNTDFIMENTFWIGLYPGLSTEHLEYSVLKIKNFFKL